MGLVDGGPHSHVTPVVTLSLTCVLFLMEAAKRVDSTFGAPYHPHSKRCNEGCAKMAEEITGKNLTKDVSDCTTPVYVDKCDIGWKKLTTTTSISIQVYQRRMNLTVSHASLIHLQESGMIQE